jgi:hypothetical protein
MSRRSGKGKEIIQTPLKQKENHKSSVLPTPSSKSDNNSDSGSLLLNRTRQKR